MVWFMLAIYAIIIFLRSQLRAMLQLCKVPLFKAQWNDKITAILSAISMKWWGNCIGKQVSGVDWIIVEKITALRSFFNGEEITCWGSSLLLIKTKISSLLLFN